MPYEQAVEKRFPDTNMRFMILYSQREVFFNSPDLGDIKGDLRKGWDPSFPILAPFFDTSCPDSP